MKTCMVTGGAGFVASHVADELLKQGHRVVLIDDLSTGDRKNLNPKATFYQMKVQEQKIREVFKKERPEVLFHFAAQIDVRKSVENPQKDADTNILGSLNLLENCRNQGVEKVVFASTGGAIYGEASQLPTPESYPAHPLSPYGVAKLSVEHYLGYYLAVHKIPFVALRLSNVYGPRQSTKGEAGVVALFLKALLSGRRPLVYGKGKQTRDFVFVKDVALACTAALNKKRSGTYNIGTGKETSVNELLEMLKKLTKSSLKEQRLPARAGEQNRSCLNSSLARKELAWRPRTQLMQGLQKTAAWFQAQ